MTYHIYDKTRKRFMASIDAENAEEALIKYAQEMAITNYWISHSDTLKTKEGFRLWAISW